MRVSRPPRPRRITRRAVGMGAAGLVGAGIGVGLVRRRVRSTPPVGEDAFTVAGLHLPADATHHEIEIDDGGRVHAVERGSGPPIVLVHGITASSACWARQFAGLSDDHRVIALDWRGHGQSMAGSGGFGFDRMADDLLAVLDALDVHRAVLAGHSMGGMITLHTALRSPDRLQSRVAGLALVGTSPGPPLGVTFPPLVAAGLLAAARRPLLAADRRGKGLVPQGTASTVLSRLPFGSRADRVERAFALSLAGVIAPSAMAELLGAMADFDVRDRLGEIVLPTRVVAGTRDLLLPPFHSRRLVAGIPGASLTMLAGCGHMVMLERPEALDAVLRELSRTVGGPRLLDDTDGNVRDGVAVPGVGGRDPNDAEPMGRA